MSSIAKSANSIEGERNWQVLKRVELAARIFREHGDLIRDIIRFNVPKEADADDIFQDFFLSLVSRPVPDTVQNIKAYLYRAIKNDITDASRRTKNYKSTVQRYAQCHKYRTMRKRPNNIVAQSEKVQKIFQIIEHKLPPREFQAITERFVHDHSINEAARRMHIGEKTYSRYLWLGLRKIRSILINSGMMNFGNSNM